MGDQCIAEFDADVPDRPAGTYVYDDRGHLVEFAIDDSPLIPITSYDGSPLVVFNRVSQINLTAPTLQPDEEIRRRRFYLYTLRFLQEVHLPSPFGSETTFALYQGDGPQQQSLTQSLLRVEYQGGNRRIKPMAELSGRPLL